MIAGDTRLTDGQYGINTRYAPKVWDVGDNIVITANGYSADGDTLVKRISQKIEVLLIPATRFSSKTVVVVSFTLEPLLCFSWFWTPADYFSGTIMRIIVLLQFLPSHDSHRHCYTGNGSFRIMCILSSED